MVRSIVLGSLLPRTDDSEKDLEIFEGLMGFDDEGLARRALIQNALKPKDLASCIALNNPWDFFTYTIKTPDISAEKAETWEFPFDADAKGIKLRWRRDIDDDKKLILFRKALDTFGSYEEKALRCKRPDEADQNWLFAPVWRNLNDHYAHLGINARSHQELVEQLGILRYGHRPLVGDAFCGGGSIPFEAARLGCDVNASDLNPVACMLTWGALNIIGAHPKRRSEIERLQQETAQAVDKEITELDTEHDEHGNRAKAFLYCLETRCPETGWMVPLAPAWVISKTRNVAARLSPNYRLKRFDIEVVTGATTQEMKAAEAGTVRNGMLVYELDGKIHRTPINTLRGDYRNSSGITRNRLRQWDKHDFKPASDDIFQECLYAIQWIRKDSLNRSRQETFFESVTASDLTRERMVENFLTRHIVSWQENGLIPDMQIESGAKTDEPIRTRGWTYWHHLFNARQLLSHALVKKHSTAETYLNVANCLNWNSKLSPWDSSRAGEVKNSFYNQAVNPLFNYGCRSWFYQSYMLKPASFYSEISESNFSVECRQASHVPNASEIWITDPPYADAVRYHEITEFFISWLRKNPPGPFNRWTWDSRRALAIKGSGDDFRLGMIDAYRAMAENMPDDGMQCVMFTHQDTGVWSDMIGIFWAAGLQVVAAWYIATETTSALRKGGYVQGTVILMLRKRDPGNRAGFKQRILPAVRTEVKRQIETMMHLNDEVKNKMGAPVFNDSDLQMAGYAAALKVLTAYTQIGGEDITTFAMRPRRRGEVTVVDEIVQQAAEAANSLLVPEGISSDTWHKLNGIQRFYLRMMDMESTGASKLDNYQNFAKAFRVSEYHKLMADMTANKARLKHVTDFASRDLTESTKLGRTWLGRLIIGLQQLLAETEPQVVIGQLQTELPDFTEARPLLIDMLSFMEKMAPEDEVRQAAETLGARLRNLRALGQ